MNRLLTLQGRPNRSIDLLLRANLAPDDTAVRAWKDWLQIRSVDDANWPEVRLLAPFARRITTLDPSSPLRAKLQGIAKAHWTRTQLIILECASALDALRTANIDYILFKGAAHYAECLASATRRIMSDVDILVRSESLAATHDRICEAGWSPKSRSMSRQLLSQVRIGLSYRRGEFGAIDLHHQVFHFSRRDGELDASLWRNAQLAHLGTRAVLVPSPADSVVISIAHGLRSGNGDWAIDIGYRIAASQMEWGRIALIAKRRGLVPHVLAGLSYLKMVGVDVPQSILDCLQETRPTLGECLKYSADCLRRPNVPRTLTKTINVIANTMLPPEQYRYYR